MKTRMLTTFMLVIFLTLCLSLVGSAQGISTPWWGETGDRTVLRNQLLNAPDPRTGSVYCVAVSPNYASDSTVLATVSSADPPCMNLYRSRDGGQTWQLLRSCAKRAFFSPTYVTDRTLFIFEGSTVRRSTDDGATWQTVLDGAPWMQPNDLAFSPEFATDHTIYLPMTQGNNLARSTDDGASFQWVYSGLPTGYMIYTAAFSPNYGLDRTIFLGYYKEGIARSTNAGSSFDWSRAGAESTYVESFGISPAFASDRTILAMARGDSSGETTAGLYRSVDGGLTWTRSPSFATAPSAVWFAPKAAYVTHQGRVYRSSDGGSTWTLAASLEAQPGPFLSPASLQASSDGRYVFVGTVTGIAYSEDYGATWIRPSDAMTTTILPSGGTITANGTITITFPAGAFASDTDVVYTWLQGQPTGYFGGNRVFDLAAFDSATGTPVDLAPGKIATIVARYDDAGLTPAQEEALSLRRRIGLAWTTAGISSTVDTTTNVLTATASHLSTFGVLGTHQVFLPAVLRNY